MNYTEAIEWCKQQHRNTNHLYDGYLPYEYHLNMVAKVCNDFAYLLKSQKVAYDLFRVACYGHDLIEDCRITYNDLRQNLGVVVAEIVYAVTNDKGKNRKERASKKHYEEMRQVHGAVFIKLCDRIANAQYSRMTNSKMFNLYQKENDAFVDAIYDEKFQPMFELLNSILKEETNIPQSVN